MGEQDTETLREILESLRRTLEDHMESEAAFRPKVEELIVVLERLKGVVTFLKVVIYIGGIGWAILSWAKDHVKL